MPYKNKDKVLHEGFYYHAYNRGYNKQKIFLDDHDYSTFIYLIKKYLDPKFEVEKMLDNGSIVKILPPKLNDHVELHVLVLMPNHFHMILRQVTQKGMPKLMNPLLSSYSSYFNKKYGKNGSIWQGTYKAVVVRSEEQLMHLSRYTHANPLDIGVSKLKLHKYPWSSLQYYVDKPKPSWLVTKNILQATSKKDYLKFVQEYKKPKPDEEDEDPIYGLRLD